MAADPITVRALDAVALRDRLAQGSVSALDVADAYLARIAAREADVGAWAWHDADYVRHQARALDQYRHTGRPLGPLHGLPVGLKDVIDTARIPTENGFSGHAGRVPQADAWVVERLKQAGAIIMGKTVSTELAFAHPGKTRNPHNLGHTPGGSSSGSAAAVADAMVLLAVGTQTAGSVIRPAAFCGVTGFKPTFGAIPRRGVLMQSPTLDTIGVFARTPQDAALLAEVLYGHDAGDPATRLAPAPRLLETCVSAAPVRPTLAFVRPPGWEEADPETHAAFAELIVALGEQVFEVGLPSAFDHAAEQRALINFAEMAKFFYTIGRDKSDALSAETLEAMQRGNATLARDYLAALDWQSILNAGLDEVFARCDAILCPAALGPAPRGLDSTGSPIFNGLWTFCGIPAVTVPAMVSQSGLPMGVQLVGPREMDGRLLRTARWLMEWLEAA